MKEKPGDILYKNLLVRNRLANWGLRTINHLIPPKSADLKKFEYKKILICNNAHLGDVILSTSILHLLKEKFPGVKIDFLCGSWAKEIVSSHPLIDNVIVYDHWKLNRSKQSLFSKFLQQVKTYRQAVNDIKVNDYDLAIDLYFFYPNSIFLLWKAGVPIRIGYSSAGFGNLLTHSISWEYKKQSVVFYHLDLIKQIVALDTKDLEYVKPVLSTLSKKTQNRVQSLLTEVSSDYIVIHVGTGLASKEWPLASWKKLVTHLNNNGYSLLFTGYGEREDQIISEITKNCTNYLNLCNQTSLQETAYIIKNAMLLLCVDSVAGHLASAWNVPTIIIGNGINDDLMWKPYSSNSTYIVNNVRCMPCYTGCQEMECVKMIRVDYIFPIIEKIISK